MQLQEWFNIQLEKEENKELIYNGGAKAQVMWVRDVLSYMIWNNIPAARDIKDIQQTMTVDSTHTSKSCLLPVYQFRIDDVTINVRGNFHDWCVQYNKPVHFPEWMKVHEMTGFYEGMSRGYPTEFCVGSKEKMYSIIWWMLNEGE